MLTLKEEYLEALKKIETINVCIVGQDPYAKGSNGIAFCKNEFSDFFDESCSGKDVLFSLGFDEGWIRSNYDDPIDLFRKLLHDGIAFINVSHTPFSKAKKVDFIEDQEYNNAFLEKSKNIILLGTSYTRPHFKEYYDGFEETETVCHPSFKAKSYDQEKWAKIYESSYLAKYK